MNVLIYIIVVQQGITPLAKQVFICLYERADAITTLSHLCMYSLEIKLYILLMDKLQR